MFAKYLSVDGCLIKTNTINFDNDDDVCFVILGHLLLLDSP